MTYQEKKESSLRIQEKYGHLGKNGWFTVYCLPKENYVGYTGNFYKRFIGHKNAAKRNIEGAYILGEYKTKREALDVEASYHAKGFKGAVPKNVGLGRTEEEKKEIARLYAKAYYNANKEKKAAYSRNRRNK